MRGLSGIDAVDGVRGLLAWWGPAGVDEAIGEEPHGWLAPRVPARTTHAPAAIVADSAALEVFPSDIQTFHAWLALDTSLTEAGWGTPDARVMPSGQAAARLMVITDVPDTDDVTTGKLLGGEA